MIAMLLGGCSTYYQSYYPDSGVYYGDSGVYGHGPGYSSGAYRPVNPVDYPYWSIDYFYFSQYYHPYSVYVGYHEPLYYPYPGWALGHYRPAGWHGSLAFGFGYPWYGHGYRYPAYTFGFFSAYDPFYHGGYYRHDRRDRHRIRRIDQRLEALQRGDSYASRRQLLGRDRVANRVGGGVYDRSGSRNATRSPSHARSRADLLRQRGSGTRRELQRRAVAPDRSIQRRTPAIRSERRTDRRALDRDRIRRDGGESAYRGHRGIPIDGLRGRVIVDSRNGRKGEARNRDMTRGSRIGDASDIRRAPAAAWNRGERGSRQAPSRASGRADTDDRGSLLNRATRAFRAPPSRPAGRSAPPPSRPARDMGRPANRNRAASPSRQSLMRQRPADAGGGGTRRDARRRNR